MPYSPKFCRGKTPDFTEALQFYRITIQNRAHRVRPEVESEEFKNLAFCREVDL
jgi:hypothetical protein